jgi:hypothetical protein
MKRLLFLLVPLFLFASHSQAGEKLKTPWSLSYGDGSANQYRFGQDLKESQTYFEYFPVRPENSSTGTYSGGEPRQGDLSAKQTAELKKWLNKLESDKSLHTESRDKGTGAFTVRSGDETRSFIIQMGPELREFDQFLKKL